MDDAFAPALLFSVVAICVTFLVWDARRRKTPKHDERFDRLNVRLQHESDERGRLSKRLAQAETKIAQIRKRMPDPVSGSGNGGNDAP